MVRSTRLHDWFRMILKVAGLVLFLLGFALPALISYQSIREEFIGLGILSKIDERHFYSSGCIYRGEMWLATSKRDLNAATFSYELLRLDLKTGEFHRTGIRSDHGKPSPTPFILGNELYVAAWDQLYRVEGSALVDIGSLPEEKSNQRSRLFMFDGRPTLIVQFLDSRFRMIHLVDGKWIEGREILLPDVRQTWRDDPQTGQQTLLPLTSFNESVENYKAESFWIHVTSDDSNHHLFVVGWVRPINQGPPQQVGFYRRSFEFAQEEHDVASAIAPENWRHEATGWRLAFSALKALHLSEIQSDSIGPLLSFAGSSTGGGGQSTSSRICRSDEHGKLVDVVGIPAKSYGSIMTDPWDGAAYFVEQTPYNWNGVAVHRIVDNQIQPPFLTSQSSARRYVGRWRSICIGMVLAWLAHYVLLAMAALCWEFQSLPKCYEYEQQQATNARIWRRIAAGTFDNSIVLLMAFGLWHLIPSIGGRIWSEREYTALGDQLQTFAYEFHRYFKYVSGGGAFVVSDFFALKTYVEPMLIDHWKMILIWSAVIAFALLVKFCIEGLSGFTPGKLLFRIRTVNSALDCPGILRSFIRTIFLPFDFLLCLSPLPAMLLMTLSSANRRMGDHFATTIVIHVGSIKEVDWRSDREISQCEQP